MADSDSRAGQGRATGMGRRATTARPPKSPWPGLNRRRTSSRCQPGAESRPRAALCTREGLEAQRFGMLARTLSR